MNLTEKQVKQLTDMADRNAGHCEACGRVIAIYRYKINKGHAQTLKQMAAIVHETGSNKINMNDMAAAYSDATQRTKLRLHGLIAKYKENDVHVASTWLITKKGWSFLKGDYIPEQVIVFDNQVLGHGDERTNIFEVLPMSAPVYEQEDLNQAEAERYKNVRTPIRKALTLRAELRRSQFGTRLLVGVVYTLTVRGLEVGKPVLVTSPEQLVYPDIASFQRSWKLIKEDANA